MIDLSNEISGNRLLDRSSPNFQGWWSCVTSLYILHTFGNRSRDAVMATNFRHKIGVFGRRSFIVTLPFENGLKYQNAERQMRSELHAATSCSNLVRFGSVTPEFRLLIFVFV